MKRDWEIKKLGEIGNIFSGNSINEKEKKTYMDLSKKGLFYVATKDISTDSEIEYGNGILIPDECLSKFKIAHKDSVLICAEGGSAGKKLAYNSEYDVCFVNKLFAFESKNSIFPKFVFYYYQSSDFSKHFKNRLAGLIGGVSLQKFKEIQCPVPPLEEQKRIVKILDEKFAQLESLKANAQTNLQNAKDLFQSQLTKAFSNTTWEKRRLGDVCEIITGPFGSSIHKTDYVPNGIPMINPQNIVDGYIIPLEKCLVSGNTAKNLERFKFVENDIVIARRGEMGRCAVIRKENENWLCGTGSFIIRSNSRKVNSDFLQTILSSKESKEKLEKESIGATMPNLNQGILGNFEIPLPPLPEQKRIVKELDILSEKVKALQNIYEQMLLDCEELKQSFLCKAFAGEL